MSLALLPMRRATFGHIVQKLSTDYFPDFFGVGSCERYAGTSRMHTGTRSQRGALLRWARHVCHGAFASAPRRTTMPVGPGLGKGMAVVFFVAPLSYAGAPYVEFGEDPQRTRWRQRP